MKAMGTPDLNSELRQTVVAGLLEEVGERSIEQLAAKENEVLVGLLALRARSESDFPSGAFR